MRIRKARSEDLPQFINLWWQMHTHHYQYEKKYYQLRSKAAAMNKSLEYHSKQISNPEAVFLVAQDGTRVVGYLLVLVMERPPVYPSQKTAYVDSAFVVPEYRGKGLFRKLFQRMLKSLKKFDALVIELDVDIDNQAVSVYKNIGFKTRQYKMVYPLYPD